MTTLTLASTTVKATTLSTTPTTAKATIISTTPTTARATTISTTPTTARATTISTTPTTARATTISTTPSTAKATAKSTNLTTVKTSTSTVSSIVNTESTPTVVTAITASSTSNADKTNNFTHIIDNNYKTSSTVEATYLTDETNAEATNASSLYKGITSDATLEPKYVSIVKTVTNSLLTDFNNQQSSVSYLLTDSTQFSNVSIDVNNLNTIISNMQTNSIDVSYLKSNLPADSTLQYNFSYLQTDLSMKLKDMITPQTDSLLTSTNSTTLNNYSTLRTGSNTMWMAKSNQEAIGVTSNTANGSAKLPVYTLSPTATGEKPSDILHDNTLHDTS